MLYEEDSPSSCGRVSTAAPEEATLTEQWRTSGWVGWDGITEFYPLSGRPPRRLAIRVAPSAACGPLAHLHAGSVWNGGVRLAQLIERGFLGERLAGRAVAELGAGAGLASLVLLAQPMQKRARHVVLTDFDAEEITTTLRVRLITISTVARKVPRG